MMVPVDTSKFPTGGPDITYDDPEELAEFELMRADAQAYIQSFQSSQPIEAITLAFGLTPLLALFLVRFTSPIERGELEGERELWVVVGDVPTMYFETELTPTPKRALQLYFAIAKDWAERVLAGDNLSESYPISVEPTREHAEMLLSRVEFIEEKFIPLA